MHPNTGVGSSRGEQMGLGNFQLFRFFTYRHLEHDSVLCADRYASGRSPRPSGFATHWGALPGRPASQRIEVCAPRPSGFAMRWGAHSPAVRLCDASGCVRCGGM